MSTCRGAAPPHDGCVHRHECDWVAPFSAKQDKELREQEAMIRLKFPDNRQGRRALERALKKRALR